MIAVILLFDSRNIMLRVTFNFQNISIFVFSVIKNNDSYKLLIHGKKRNKKTD